MIAETFPNIYYYYSNRLAVETMISQDSKGLSQEDRLALIREPFEIMAGAVERRYGGSTQFDRRSGAGCLLTLLTPIIVLVGGGRIWTSRQSFDSYIIPAAGIIFMVGLFITVFFSRHQTGAM